MFLARDRVVGTRFGEICTDQEGHVTRNATGNVAASTEIAASSWLFLAFACPAALTTSPHGTASAATIPKEAR